MPEKLRCTGRAVETLFKNISYDRGNANPSMIAGYDGDRKVRDITFENLVINGKVISDQMEKPHWFSTPDMAGIFVGEHVDGLTFRPSPSTARF